MPTEDSRTTPPSRPAALMRAAQAIVDRRRQMATSAGTESPGRSIRPPPADPGPQSLQQEVSRAPEQGARSFQWVQAQPGWLFGSIDVITVSKADGSGHEVRHLDTGKVIAEGRDASAANAGAQDVARKLGRRRLLSWLLADESSPPSWTQNPKVFSLYDGAMRQGSAWQTAHHNGEAIDRGTASQRYKDLQDQLKKAITSADTPDEARLPLATAGQQLFTGANIAGVIDADKLPYSALYAGTGAMAFSGGGSAGPRATPIPKDQVLPTRRGIYVPAPGPYRVEPEQIGPREPKSPLEEGVSYADPAPTVYKGQMSPDTPVQDHNLARALGGDATDKHNLDTRAWAENSRKGAYEGQYKESREQLIDGGLTPEQADWVLEEELHWIQTDVHATPVDPSILKDLPSP